MAEIMSYGEQYDISAKSCLFMNLPNLQVTWGTPILIFYFILFPFGQENLSFIQSLPPSIQSICVQIVENNQSN